MTDIEALRAMVRELAEAAKAADARYDLGVPERGDQDAIVDFGLSCTPDTFLALDAETTRLREELDRVTRERDEALDLAYGSEGEARLAEARAEEAEAALAEASQYDVRKMSAPDIAVALPGSEHDRLKRICERAFGAYKQGKEIEELRAALAKRDEEVAGLLTAIEQVLDDMRHGLTAAPATHALALHTYATTGGTDPEILQGHADAKAMLTDLGYLRAEALTKEPPHAE